MKKKRIIVMIQGLMDISIKRLQGLVKELESNLHGDYKARPDNVYLAGEGKNRELIGKFVETLLVFGSRIQGAENLRLLHKYSQEGKACLLLLEHYSNLDYPAFYRLVEKEPLLGPRVSDTILPVQGMKLSESSSLTAAFSNSYNTVVIYPSRSIDGEKDLQKKTDIRAVSFPINQAALREITRRKYGGNIILVFPSGTRYRPWVPDSKRGVREIDNYLKSFDYVCFVAVNGNVLEPSQSDEMEKDILRKDLLLFTVSPPVDAKVFRKERMAATPPGGDSKQFVVDGVMETLEKMHQEVEPGRLDLQEAVPEEEER